MFDPNSPVFAGFSAGRAKSLILPSTTTGCWIADALNLSLADNALIGSLENKINARPAFVATGSDRPTLKKNIVGGRSVLRFGGNQYLDAGDDYDLSSQSLTIFLVAKRAATDGTLIAKSADSTGTGRWAVISGLGVNGGLFETASGTKVVSNSGFNVVDTNFALYEMRINRAAGAYVLVKNGSVLQTTSFLPDSDNASNAQTLKLGRYSINSPDFFMGDIACAVACQQSGDITSGERAALYDSIEAYYGVTL